MRASENISFIGLIYFAIALPFQQAWLPVYACFAFFLTDIIVKLLKGNLQYHLSLRHLLLFALFAFTAMRAFPTITSAGEKEISLFIPLVLTGLLSPGISFTRNQLNKVWMVFGISLSLGFLISLIMGIPDYQNYGDSTQFFYMKLCRFLERQPHYLALFSAAAFFGIALQMKPKEVLSKKYIGHLVLLAILAAYILMLSARAQIFAFGLVSFIAILFGFGIKKKLGTGVLVAIGVMLLLTLGILSSPKAKERLANSVTQADLMVDETGKEDPRKATWMLAVDVIQEKWLWGTGTGKATEYLHEKAIAADKAWLADRKLNYHNQYLQTWAALGLLGLMLLVLWLKASFIVAIRHTNWKLCCAFMLLGISLLTESMLLRQSGVLFLCFLLFFANLTPESKRALPFWKYL